jgi:uncharacterized protein
MEFEFDETKSDANREKHGLDFVAAQAMWQVAGLDQPLIYAGERREMRTGQIGEKLWSAIYTLRGAAIRLISVRRARQDEVDDYGRHVTKHEDDHQR